MNSKQIVAVASLAVLLTGVLALPTFAVGNYITLPETFLADIKAAMDDVFSDLAIPIVLIISLPLAFWFIKKVIGLARAR